MGIFQNIFVSFSLIFYIIIKNKLLSRVGIALRPEAKPLLKVVRNGLNRL